MAQPSLTADATSVDPAQLEIVRLRVLRGPNYWRLAPVIACDLRLGHLEKENTADVPGFTDRLIEVLPSLREHPCSRERPGGLIERLVEGTSWPHVLEHVALELQTLAGTDVSFGRWPPEPKRLAGPDVSLGRLVESGEPGLWWVIVEYEEEEVGLAGVRQAAAVMRACMSGAAVDAAAILQNLRVLYEDVRLGPSTGVIVEEARRRGIPVRRLGSGSLVQLGMGRYPRRMQAPPWDGTSIIAADIAQDKDLTKRMLQGIGLAVPTGAVARDV